jgi:hypothetical protein
MTHLRSGIAAIVIAGIFIDGIVNVDSGGPLCIGKGLRLGLEFASDTFDIHLLLRQLPRLLRPRPYFGQFRILLSPLLFTLLPFLRSFALLLLRLESDRFRRIGSFLCL